MEHKQADNKRRYSDQPSYIRKIGGLSIVTVAATVAAIAAVGNMFWQSKDNAITCQQQLEARIVTSEKDIVKVFGKLETIDERTRDMQETQKIILREVRK